MGDVQSAELDEHRASPFPAGVDKGEIYGEVEPVMIDADIIGWISHGRLTPVQKRSLREASDQLDRSLRSFPSDAQPYYERLLRIARRALAAD
ncbi:MAG TPA: hypothetical protein VNQ53_09300 [Nocardioides sp.]|nr:hypothetical protein [Nocardioides sp.]